VLGIFWKVAFMGASLEPLGRLKCLFKEGWPPLTLTD
jgi:hypothetical protein